MEHALALPAPGSEAPRGWLARLDVKRRLMRLPLPVQVFLTFSFSQLLALTLAIPDLLPLVDEMVAGWLFYVGVSATAATVRERYGERLRRIARRDPKPAEPVARSLPDLETDASLEPSLVEATLRELEGLA